ncbi:HNH endonuclease [Streptomyces sp. tea 10]|nr:HNH endonuclease [Streptomyces sp. tea 10]
MIATPVSYGVASAALVVAYNNAPTQHASRWGDDDVEPTRKEIKQHYISEQQHLCCYCGLPDPAVHGLDWDVEHITPRNRHPEFMFTPENLAVSCRECNGHKASKETLVDPSASAYPSTGDAFLIVHPHFDDWANHILRDHLAYAAFTAKGKWTIKECNLNRFTGRSIGLRYPISDTRYEEPVRRLLDGGMTLQEVVSNLGQHSE